MPSIGFARASGEHSRVHISGLTPVFEGNFRPLMDVPRNVTTAYAEFLICILNVIFFVFLFSEGG